MEPYYTGNPEEAEELARSRDRFAAVLSIIPGLGHMYKAHYFMGAAFLLVGLPVVIGATGLLLLATFGLSLLLPLLYVALVGAHAHEIEDRQWHPQHGRSHG